MIQKYEILDRAAEKYLSRIGELRSVIDVPLVNRIQQPFERSTLYYLFPAARRVIPSLRFESRAVGARLLLLRF